MGRRRFCAGVCGLVALAACGGADHGDASRDPADGCTDLPPGDDDGWVSVPVEDYPELLEVGGQASISVPERLLQVVVAQVAPDCFVAVWRICPHGACDLEWRPDEVDLWCPCHGSRFDLDGTLLQGPAERDARTFPAEVRDGMLRIHRPL